MLFMAVYGDAINWSLGLQGWGKTEAQRKKPTQVYASFSANARGQKEVGCREEQEDHS